MRNGRQKTVQRMQSCWRQSCWRQRSWRRTGWSWSWLQRWPTRNLLPTTLKRMICGRALLLPQSRRRYDPVGHHGHPDQETPSAPARR